MLRRRVSDVEASWAFVDAERIELEIPVLLARDDRRLLSQVLGNARVEGLLRKAVSATAVAHVVGTVEDSLPVAGRDANVEDEEEEANEAEEDSAAQHVLAHALAAQRIGLLRGLLTRAAAREAALLGHPGVRVNLEGRCRGAQTSAPAAGARGKNINKKVKKIIC